MDITQVQAFTQPRVSSGISGAGKGKSNPMEFLELISNASAKSQTARAPFGKAKSAQAAADSVADNVDMNMESGDKTEKQQNPDPALVQMAAWMLPEAQMVMMAQPKAEAQQTAVQNLPPQTVEVALPPPAPTPEDPNPQQQTSPPVAQPPVQPSTPPQAQQGPNAPIISDFQRQEMPEEFTVPQGINPLVNPQLPVDEVNDRFGNMVDQAARELADARTPPPEQHVPTRQTTPTAFVDGLSENQRLIEENQTQPPRTPENNAPQTARPARANNRDSDVNYAQTQGLSTPTRPSELRAEQTAPEPSPQTAPSPSAQIHAEVLRNLENQKMEFRMQLQPAELGKIDIRMAIDSGRLIVEIISSSARTSELLGRQMDGLAASFRNNTDLSSVQIVNATSSISSAQSDGSPNMSANGQQQGGQQNAHHAHRGSFLSGGDVEITQQEAVLETQHLLNYTV